MPAGPNVTLAPLRPEDSEALFGWINDRELVVLNAPFEPVERADHDRWFDRVRSRDDVEVFGIRRNADGVLIGSCQLREIDRGAGRCELQIRIGDRTSWSHGYGTEAVELLLGHAFGRLGLAHVELQVFAGNERAIRAYEKAGFSRVEVLPGAVVIEGVETDVVVMAARAGEEPGGDGP